MPKTAIPTNAKGAIIWTTKSCNLSLNIFFKVEPFFFLVQIATRDLVACGVGGNTNDIHCPPDNGTVKIKHILHASASVTMIWVRFFILLPQLYYATSSMTPLPIFNIASLTSN